MNEKDEIKTNETGDRGDRGGGDSESGSGRENVTIDGKWNGHWTSCWSTIQCCCCPTLHLATAPYPDQTRVPGVDELDGIVCIVHVQNRQNRAENLVLHNRIGRLNIDKDRGRNVTILQIRFTTDRNIGTLQQGRKPSVNGTRRREEKRNAVFMMLVQPTATSAIARTPTGNGSG